MIIVLVHIVSVSNLVSVFSEEDKKYITQVIDQTIINQNSELTNLTRRVDDVAEACNITARISNEAVGLSFTANGISIKAFKESNEALALAKLASESARETMIKTEQLNKIPEKVAQLAQDGIKNLESEYDKIKRSFADDVTRARKEQAEIAERRDRVDLEHKIKIAQAKINEKKQQGIYEQEEKMRAAASVEVESVKWEKLREILNDSKLIIKIVLAIVVVILSIYVIKYGIPMFVNYFTRPYVVSETSKPGWFGWWASEQTIDINDLFFAPSLQKQLSDFLLRAQTAKKYNENLPNILFYGPSGTGKTAFAKALAYNSGLDYALTSGSEFAKITDLDIAHDELCKLLEWAKNSENGLVLFIDEAESLFANRKLATTSKATQDFINTFLSLISEQSQKNVLFIFATNHPFKLDDAIINRIGMSIQFMLPEAIERERILARYLTKCAQENNDARVNLPGDVMSLLPKYAESLEGFSPRAIKFLAEAMVIKARRQPSMQLTNEIAQEVIDEARRIIQKNLEWEKERDQWVEALGA